MRKIVPLLVNFAFNWEDQEGFRVWGLRLGFRLGDDDAANDAAAADDDEDDDGGGGGDAEESREPHRSPPCAFRCIT